MPHLPIIQYLLKLSISLTVVYLFYALVLRRLTFYTWNRWYLLGYSLLAFFIPFVNISPMVDGGAWQENIVVQWIPVMDKYQQVTPASTLLNGWLLPLSLLLIGIGVMLVRLLVQYFSLLHIRRSSRLLSDNTVKIYQVDKKIIPFSFGRSIFINQHLHTEHELKEIIRHEFIHVKQRHTADILWAELVCILNWYNPFAWLIRKAIRQNLEYIADHQVLKTGLDRKQYQYMLLKVVGVPAFSITNQFNFSSLKKRILMMNKMRSARVHLIKFLFVVPLLTVLLLAFRTAAIEQELSVQPAVSFPVEKLVVASPVIVQQDTVPVKGKVSGGEVQPIHGLKIVPVSDSGRYMTAAGFRLNGLRQPGASPVSNVLFVVDEVEQVAGEEVLNNLDPRDIESITVLKDKVSREKYGERGMNGVILINTKKGYTPPPPPPPPVKDTVPRVHIVINGKDVGNSLSRFDGIILVDGTILDSQEIKNLPLQPEDIHSIDVIKGGMAEEQYGEKAKGGVIKITTKKARNRITGMPGKEEPPLFSSFRKAVDRQPTVATGRPVPVDARHATGQSDQ